MAASILSSLSASNIFDLRGVVAIVTGGGTGIGMMISSTLVANGATVYIIGPVQEDLDRVCENYNTACESVSTRGRMHGVAGDVRLKSEATRLAVEISKREKAVTVLFNNAGITTGNYERPPPDAPASAYVSAYLDQITQEQFTDVLNTNAVGPYWLTFAFLPLLEAWKTTGVTEPGAEGQVKARFAPQIVMTSSMNGWTKDPATGGFSFPYLFSKSALGHATASLAHELLPLGIRVNGIAPGLFATGMTTHSWNEHGVSTLPPSFQPSFTVPAEDTVGSTRDMGSLALFLVANWFVNGETVLIDGGTLLKHPSSY
ncbi:NAD(P)-binding protein [Roridomyces roridus]|uniref:NAD(P)-binding protein n=1 Tax=Roridomyces roridus TaxID=1738132 RepID=A0AAD7FMQ6_9AGAR|nr:NAD(P)-binding protein [Roridomyces roridus]